MTPNHYKAARVLFAANGHERDSHMGWFMLHQLRHACCVTLACGEWCKERNQHSCRFTQRDRSKSQAYNAVQKFGEFFKPELIGIQMPGFERELRRCMAGPAWAKTAGGLNAWGGADRVDIHLCRRLVELRHDLPVVEHGNPSIGIPDGWILRSLPLRVAGTIDKVNARVYSTEFPNGKKMHTRPDGTFLKGAADGR